MPPYGIERLMELTMENQEYTVEDILIIASRYVGQKAKNAKPVKIVGNWQGVSIRFAYGWGYDQPRFYYWLPRFSAYDINKINPEYRAPEAHTLDELESMLLDSEAIEKFKALVKESVANESNLAFEREQAKKRTHFTLKSGRKAAVIKQNDQFIVCFSRTGGTIPRIDPLKYSAGDIRINSMPTMTEEEALYAFLRIESDAIPSYKDGKSVLLNFARTRKYDKAEFDGGYLYLYNDAAKNLTTLRIESNIAGKSDLVFIKNGYDGMSLYSIAEHAQDYKTHEKLQDALYDYSDYLSCKPLKQFSDSVTEIHISGYDYETRIEIHVPHDIETTRGVWVKAGSHTLVYKTSKAPGCDWGETRYGGHFE